MDRIRYCGMLGMLLSCALAFNLHGGGSGFNVLVVINQDSTNSCELANYFCEQRCVPPENVLRISWTGGNASWTSNDFQTRLFTPLTNLLAASQLTNQIDYVVLSMDIPFQTILPPDANSTTAALFYGLKAASAPDVTSSYAAGELLFRPPPPAGGGPSFLATMITADTLAQAKQLVDQGVAGDHTQPAAPAVLAKTSDPARNLRHTLFDNAIFNVRLLEKSSLVRTNSDSPSGLSGLFGYETGLDRFTVSPGTFIPGAIADSFTSFGGVIFGPNSQTNLLAFIDAGAAGSYGTVAEPGTDPEKFPDPQVYFFQARGFSLAEAYYQSIDAPFLGLIVAEPLSAPFADAGGIGGWATNLANATLTGTSNLSVSFSGFTDRRPLQQVDLFVDGKYFSTLTNLAPRPGNLLNLSLNGYPLTWTVPTNAMVATLVSDLTTLINSPAAQNATRVRAYAHGDRIELHSIATNLLTAPFYVADGTTTNTSGLSYWVSYLPDSFPPTMTVVNPDKSGAFRMEVGIPAPLPYVIQASTDLTHWQPISTNLTPGLLDFRDPDAANFPARFYRMAWPDPDQPPKVSAMGASNDGVFQMHIDSAAGRACAIQASTDLLNWDNVYTNLAGGPAEFFDADSALYPARFFRTWLLPPAAATFSTTTSPSGGTLVRIDSAERPYVVQVSTNGSPWSTLSTNFAIGQVQTTAGSSPGSADMLSTYLTVSRSRFLPSEAFGRQSYTIISNAPATGSYVQFTFTLTNNTTVVVGVTNTGGLNSPTLANQLCALINAHPVLQGSGGVAAEDLVVDQVGATTFNLRARGAGFAAAAISVVPKRSGITLLPSSPKTLTQNWNDLQARNHVFVTAGVSNLTLTFPLDTTALADGFHELTAIAYEGTHVRTQTRTTIPVRVQNGLLDATLTLDATNTAPVSAVFHAQVLANTNDANVVTLFTTGGAFASITNQATSLFTIDGTNLCAGLHPFYAVVRTASGAQYRTDTRWLRIVNGP